MEYRDTDTPGLALRVSASGVKVFYALLWVSAQRKLERIRIGRFPSVAVPTAQRRVQELVGRVATGNNPAEEKRRYLAQSTLGDAFEAYANDRAARGKRGVDAMRAQFNRWLGVVPDAPKAKHASHPRRKPPAAVDWSRRRLGDISAREVVELHRAIVAAGRPTTANRVQEILRAVFNFAAVHPNPAAATGRGNPHGVERVPERPRRRYLTRDELPRFMDALQAQDDDWRDFFTLLLYVGFRRSAVAAMRWRDVDLIAQTWTVPGEKSKSGEALVLPLSGPAVEVLQRRAGKRKKSNPWVFPADSRSGHLENPKKAWNRLLVAAGIDDLRPHDLRRTLGSWMAAAGVSQLAIAQALGHKDPRSASPYVWLHVDAARAAQQAAHAAIASAVQSTPKPRGKSKKGVGA